MIPIESSSQKELIISSITIFQKFTCLSNLYPTWGSNSQLQDQESQAPPTELTQCPAILQNYTDSAGHSILQLVIFFVCFLFWDFCFCGDGGCFLNFILVIFVKIGQQSYSSLCHFDLLIPLWDTK